MGGNIISRKIRENLGFQNNLGTLFFNGYGERNPQMWGIFLKTLDHPDHLIAADALIDTAVLTFKNFHDWMLLHFPVKNQKSGIRS
jgi:heme oxygenase